MTFIQLSVFFQEFYANSAFTLTNQLQRCFFSLANLTHLLNVAQDCWMDCCAMPTPLGLA